uniref:Uncharacterized protein n=1 Tax=Arundo donax TaxID=35708 RepID=A0A0A9CFT5_ARUDO
MKRNLRNGLQSLSTEGTSLNS